MRGLLLALLLIPTISHAGTVVVMGSHTNSSYTPATSTYVLEETFDGATDCGDSSHTNCDLTWSAITGTPDFNYATPLEGTYSLYLAGAAANNASYDLTADDEIFGYLQYKTSDNTPGTDRTIVALYDASDNVVFFIQNKYNGRLEIDCPNLDGNTVAALPQDTLTHIWFYFKKVGTNQTICNAAFSTDGTRPTSGDNFISTVTGDAGTNFDRVRIGDSNITGMNLVIDRILLDDVQIGDSP